MATTPPLANDGKNNGEFFTHVPLEQQPAIFSNILGRNPLPVVKILAADREAIKRFLNVPRYQKIVILPTSLKRAILKNEIAVYARDWAGRQEVREARRTPLKGTLHISVDRVGMYIDIYEEMLRYAADSDLVVTDEQIIQDPNTNLLRPLGLPLLRGKALLGFYQPHTMDDREMLADPEFFDRICIGIT
jgi:hypothetical protein